jgi:hypothetical protein
LPDGFRELLAPALAPPALKFEGAVPDGAWPVVVPVGPLGGAAPTPAVPLAPEPAPPPPAPPAPCANAVVLESISAAANNVTAFIFIAVSSAVIGDKRSRLHMFLR